MADDLIHYFGDTGGLHAHEHPLQAAHTTHWYLVTCPVCLQHKPVPFAMPQPDYTDTCICDTNPSTTDGPDEACPQHGRAYGYWVQACSELERQLVTVTDRANRLGEEIAEIKGSLSQVAVYEGMEGSPTALLVSELVRDHEELEARIDATLLHLAEARTQRIEYDTVDMLVVNEAARLLRGGKRVPDDISEIEGTDG